MQNTALQTRILCAIVLIIVMILSIGPIPLTTTLCLYVVIFRPRWFKDLVERIYS